MYLIMTCYYLVTRVGYVPAHRNQVTAMPPQVEIKVKFEPYDCTPGHDRFEGFYDKLLGYSGATDQCGWSLADHFQGIDQGGPNNPLPLPAAANQVNSTINVAARKRRKESHTFLIQHISNPAWITKLSRPPFLIAYQGVLFRKVRAVPQSGAQLRLRSGGGW